MARRLRWGIIGTGVIAHRFAIELNESRTGKLVAVASRDAERAAKFGQAHGIRRRYASYDDLLADDAVDVVYIATPHPEHVQWVVRAAQAGKHVLCEKPLTVHRADAESAIDAVRARGTFLMEAFMYRCHPQTRRAVELLRDGAIGDIQVIEAVHSFRGSDDPNGRLLNPAHAGGGILDVGCYCMSGARLVAGAEPTAVTGAAHLGATGVDEWAVASVRFPGGVVAHLACGVRAAMPPSLKVYGTEGWLDVSMPWLPPRTSTMRLCRGDTTEEITTTTERGMYAIEADHVAERIWGGDTESNVVSWSDTLGNVTALDAWRRAVDLTYDLERPGSLVRPAHGGRLAVRSRMAAASIGGVRTSRVVLGTMLAHGASTWPTAMAVFDAFFEAGGNAFDTARRYGNGESDRALGHWMATRGVRDRCVVIAKGAHTPHCDPDTMSRELLRSLEDLKTDRADIYFLHRDNPDVPVGEFVDVLNSHVAAGRLRGFGGSNWTAARMDAANAYAASRGLVGFTALSNQFSLARMVVPTFPGCLGASGPEWASWLTGAGIPVVAWSSQAAGFFAGVDAKAWASADNVERRARAGALGARLGVEATTIALAWVLTQPLPVFPIIGPRNLVELRSSLAALSVRLSAKDVAWLDLQ